MTNTETIITSDTDSVFSLQKYLQRICYEGKLYPDLETLKKIHLHHTETIPFENLNPLLRWPVQLDIKSLQQKIIDGKRGGYCFEQNLLLSHALKEIGFEVRWLAARVLWNRPEGTANPRTHMLLQVIVNDKSFIADAGFGGLTLTSPLKFEPNIEQPTPHEPFRLLREDEEYTLQAKIRDEWKPLYRFSLYNQALPDYEAMSWYLCNYPHSHFIKMLRAARSAPGVRYALNNNDFAVHYMGDGTERKTLTTADEILEILQSVFLIQLPDTPELKKIITQIITGTT